MPRKDNKWFNFINILVWKISLFFNTSPKSWGVIFLLQFVCLSVSVCVCVSVSVNKIPDGWMHRFWCGFRWTAAYCTDSNPIEIGDLGSNVKVTVTKNVCKNDETNPIIRLEILWPSFWYQIWPYCKINTCNPKSYQWKIKKLHLTKKNLRTCTYYY